MDLVGNEHLIRKELGKDESRDRRIKIHHCSHMVAMDELPLKVLRQKRDVSIKVAFDLARKGSVNAVVSAGNSGATIGAAVLTLRKLNLLGMSKGGIFFLEMFR